jgi:chromate transporter
VTPAEPQHRPPSLLNIGGVFTRYANLTFGGGSATIAVLREQIVERRRWITELEFQLAYALSRLTPGTNVLAFCTAVGWITRRGPGAVIALLAASIPCSAIALAATHFFEVWQQYGAFRAALRGALAAAVAIMVNTAWVLAASHVRVAPVKALVIVPLAMVLVTFAPISPFQVLLLAAGAGLLWPADERSE